MMYTYFRGKLIEATPSYVILDMNNIGYRIIIASQTFQELPQLGEEVLLHTAWVVREESQTLYGFLAREERDLFETLITLSGIGPKTALSLLGHLSLTDLAKTVQTNNFLALAKVPGIGKKTAERLLIDLRNKIPNLGKIKTARSSTVEDALSALMNLGYTQTNAEKALQKALNELSESADLSSLISTALGYAR